MKNEFPYCYCVAVQKLRWDESQDGTYEHEGHNRMTEPQRGRGVEFVAYKSDKGWAIGDTVEIEGCDLRNNWDGHSAWRASGVVIAAFRAPTLIGYELPDPTPFPELNND